MAIDILLDPITRDIDITGGVMKLTPNIETSSVQQLLIILNMNKGEYYFDISSGIPWLANRNNPIQLLDKGGDKGLIDSLVREAILARENITEIIEYQSSTSKTTRTMTISFKCRTTSGEVISVENVPLN